MKAVRFKNFRCFVDSEWVRIAPLTLLVGENSTGKSSFLAGVRIAWDLAYGHQPVDFNEEPFVLGSYDQIAHLAGGRGGRAKTFEVALETEDSEQGITFSGSFEKSGSQPRIQRRSIQTATGLIEIRKPPSSASYELVVKKGRERAVKQRLANLDDRSVGAVPLPYLIAFAGQDFVKKESNLSLLKQVAPGRLGTDEQRPLAIAPVRTRPRRTYDPAREIVEPEGAHIPFFLARTALTDPARWQSILDSLESFGKSSGLFSRLVIRTFGRKSDSDPFQVNVKIVGPATNLQDVGYGVSQVLPILVEAISQPDNQSFLVQQPEVHLHPKAQAELGSFLATLVSASKKRFIIETHSDYLIDRIRTSVRDQLISPQDVSLLFFERSGRSIKIRSLEVDTLGNLTRTPKRYREFFMLEQRKMLGI